MPRPSWKPRPKKSGGQINIGAFATAARGIAARAIVMLGQHAYLTAAMCEVEPDPGLTQLLRGDLDVLVLNDWDNNPISLPAGVEYTTLGLDLLDVIEPCSHPAANSAEVELSELGRETWIAWPAGSMCHNWLVNTLRSCGFEPRIAHTAGEHATQLALVHHGLGVAVLPRMGHAPICHQIWRHYG
ncbi:LysR family transcriptional regulator [Mycobacterium haemophilum DSM 44634]|uniref:LysR substrate-binding domain-containing protein n=1 Tax=Mycobacterium haemophilum TaxID=29311 RepID=UPI00070488A9|nr:LysR substrate-binding domain-containing protein [Mycobacterium haemophilum]ALL56259.1 hypothetical protein B586_14620 [Mycobacterium haemophilum DSM 44634]MCV7341664.1 hypothetical protein [Mycobacterium haemophilum DSM 44634]